MSEFENKTPAEILENAWKAAIKKRVASLRNITAPTDHDKASEWFGNLDKAESWLLGHLKDLKKVGICDVKVFKKERGVALDLAKWYGKAVEEDIFKHWKAQAEINLPFLAPITKKDFYEHGTGGVNIEMLSADVKSAMSKLFGGERTIENDFSLARTMAKYIGGSFVNLDDNVVVLDVDNAQAALVKSFDQMPGTKHKTPFFRGLHKMVCLLVNPESPAGWKMTEKELADSGRRLGGERKAMKKAPAMAKAKAKTMKKVPAKAMKKSPQAMKKKVMKKKDNKKPPMKKK